MATKKLEVIIEPANESVDFTDSVRTVLEYKFSKIPDTNWHKLEGIEFVKKESLKAEK